MNSSIVCIGNRFVEGDAAGLAVLDRLLEMHPLPAEIEVVEGGLAGLNLLPMLERGGRVIFVDAVKGFTQPGEIVLLNYPEIMSSDCQPHFNHGSGLTYLLTLLPKVCEGVLPEEIILVGLEGECTGQTIERAAELSITIAYHGLKR